MPPGTGDVQMGLARMLPSTSLIVVTTPALAAQKVAQRAADMARRSFLEVIGVIENMSAFTCDHGESYALFGEGGGQALAEAIDAPLLGKVPLEAAVAAGGDAGDPVSTRRRRRRRRRVPLDRRSTSSTELAPPTPPADVDMAGCTARVFEAVTAVTPRADPTVLVNEARTCAAPRSRGRRSRCQTSSS